MTAKQYRAARILRGSQSQVAKLLGVDPQTISRRERGEVKVSREAWAALMWLPEQTLRIEPRKIYFKRLPTKPETKQPQRP